MDSLNKRKSTQDDTFDHLIAFLVILGTVAFILQQSFPSNDSNVLGKQTLVEQATIPATPYSTKEKFQPISYAEQKQAERDFADAAAQNRAADLERQRIENTSYQTPFRKTNLIAPIATTSAPLITKVQETDKKVPVQKLSNTIPAKEKPQDNIAETNKEKQVFIETDLPAMKHTASSKIQQGASTVKQSIHKVKESATQATVAAQEKIAATKKQQVATYEATTPAITPNNEKLTEKGVKKKSKKTTKKKIAANENCAIIVATMQDAGNIKRLVKSLESDNYKIYNRRAGKNRTIGIKTSCTPSIYQPLLKTIRKNYFADAWLKRR